MGTVFSLNVNSGARAWSPSGGPVWPSTTWRNCRVSGAQSTGPGSGFSGDCVPVVSSRSVRCRITGTARGAPGREAAARLTLDDDIRVTPARGLAFDSDAGVSLLGGRMILELKYRAHAPALFKQLVEEFKLAPQAVSKYRIGMGALGHAKTVGAVADAADAWSSERARIAISSV